MSGKVFTGWVGLALVAWVGTVWATPNLTQAITDEINQIRVAAKLPALVPDRALSALAGEWSERMARRNRLSHRNDLFAQMKRLGYRGINENIFYATGPVTAKEVVAAWMNSPGHRRNLLAPGMNRIGVGQAVNRSGVTYFTFNSAEAVEPARPPLP